MAELAPAASASAARAFAEQREQCKVLLPFIEQQNAAANCGCATDPAALKAITDALRWLLRLTALRVGEEALANARAAAQLAVKGLAAALPPADAAGEAWRGALEDLCATLRQLNRWELLDVLAAGPCTPLFDGGAAGLYALESLARDDKDKGRWRLPGALAAVACRYAGAGDLGTAASLLALAHTEDGGCSAAAPVARVVLEALASPAGAAWLAGPKDARALPTMFEALCEHGGLEGSARLLAALQAQLAACPPAARRVLALTLANRATMAQMHAFCASLPSLLAALRCVHEELAAQQGAGPPAAPDQFGWALPEPLASQFRCSRAGSGSDRLCHACQPLVAFMRGLAMETAPIIRVVEGDAGANLEHIRGMLADLQLRCPELPKYLQHRTFLADLLAQGGRKRGGARQPPVAAARLWKVLTWHQDRLAAHRAAREGAACLEAVLAGAPQPAEAPAPAVAATAPAPLVEQQVAAMEVDPAPAAAPPAAEAKPAKVSKTAAAPAAKAPAPAAHKRAKTAKVASPVAAPFTARHAPPPAAHKPVQPVKAHKPPRPAAAAAAPVKAAAAVPPAKKQAAAPAAASQARAAVAVAASPARPKQPGAPAVAKETVQEQAVQRECPSPAQHQASPAMPVAAVTVPASPAAAGAAAALLASPAPAAAPAGTAVGTPASAVPAAPSATAAAQAEGRTPASATRILIQTTLSAGGKVQRILPADASQASDRRASLAPASTAKTADGTAKKRPAGASTAKKSGGPGSRIRATLRKQAAMHKLPTLLRWFKADSQDASLEGCRLALLFEAESQGASAEAAPRSSKRSRRL